ncbi:MAG: sigma-70 family RNA polymerase sigma factor [Bacteroidetes bacterium]|jgi:RNA polymerase sigma factor (TIGR02999 family)|nr:sigma-70 family RNA polymerase sigma factor [Bacteroidota bacterium]
MPVFEDLVQRSVDAASSDDAFRLVYDELRAMARAQLHREYGAHSLTPTALVHEAYLRLLGNGTPSVENRRHFLHLAARAMRRILIDYARRASAEKRGGGVTHVSFTERLGPGRRHPIARVLDLDRALTALAETAERPAQVVELRYFAGLTGTEIAEVLGLSRTTVQRDWTTARAWLYRYMKEDLPTDTPT